MARHWLCCTLLATALALPLAGCGDEPAVTAEPEATAAAETASSDGAPRIHFPVEVLDLGELAQGETAKGSLVVQNTGEADLAIERAKGS
jgi:hypothetical protein